MTTTNPGILMKVTNKLQKFKNSILMQFVMCMTLMMSLSPLSNLKAEILIDEVVASVDGNPITLRDVEERSDHAVAVTKESLKTNELHAQILQQIVVEKVIEGEAKNKNISVATEEVEKYIGSIASRNGLELNDFKAALQSEGRSIEGLRQQVKIDILRSKLVSTLSRDGISVSDKEITKLIDEKAFDDSDGEFVALRQILINTNGQGDGIPENRLKLIEDQLKSTDFQDVAKKYSDGPEAVDGGLVGILAVTELSEMIQEAIKDLPDHTPSKAAQSFSGYHIFYVDNRYEDGEEAKAAYKRLISETAREQKMEEYMANYFREELPKNHVVEELY